MAVQAAPRAPTAANRLQPRRRSRRGQATPYLFILPFGLLFLLFFLLPIGYAVVQSLLSSKRSGLGLGAPTTVFNGLGNFGDAMHDPAFYAGVGRVLLYGVVQVPIMLGVAFILALLMDSTVIRFKNFFRLAFFIPYAIPGVVGALLWTFLYDPQFSPIVSLIHHAGLTSFDFLGENTILWSIANIVTWEWTGYNMIILFAALQAIPGEVYEAARMDGCTGIGVARYIKAPLVAPALVLTCVLSIIGTLQTFTEPQVLSGISNNISTSFMPNVYAYNQAFNANNYYYAATLAVILALVTFVFSFGFLRLTQRYSGV